MADITIATITSVVTIQARKAAKDTNTDSTVTTTKDTVIRSVNVIKNQLIM